MLQRPLDLGADVTLLSTTKYVEGHNSTVGGSIATRDEALLERLRLVRKTLGCIQSPQESWLTLRGLKTLPLRLQQHSSSAQKVAEWLEQHPKVARVYYPGLASFPQFALAQTQQALPGGMLAFELKGGADSGIQLMNTVRLCLLAENLGAVETLITHPVSMTHGDVPREIRERTGITDGLVRLSVGLENPADIIADLDTALATIEVASSEGGRAMPGKVVVLKFGSSVLQSRADLPHAVHEIYRWIRRQYRVVAVVSAFAGETDRLLANRRGLPRRQS